MFIAVVGAGASGICAAIEIKRQCIEADVTVFEHLPKAAKKIPVTGNGRCNFTNRDLSPEHFYGDKSFLEGVLNSAYADTEKFFLSMGVLTYCEDGRVYPRSQQATSVRDALLKEADKLKVNIITEKRIDKITKQGECFLIDGKSFDAVIIAAGGKASPVHGSDGSGFALLESFSHKISPTYPALCGLTTDVKALKSLKGVRAEAKASLYSGNELYGCESGEIQFTDKGISGIPVMNLSHLVKNNKGLRLHLDLCEELSEAALINHILNFKNNNPCSTLEELLCGIVNSKIGYCVINRTINTYGVLLKNLSLNDIKTVAQALKCFKFNIKGTRDFSNAQISCGGAQTNEFYSNTLMSKKVPGLFACGEVLNLHGDCGGYNLHLAWTTGRIAGASAVKFLKG